MYKSTETLVTSRHILSIGNHQEISAALKAFCEEKGILSGAVYGLGAIKGMTLRFLDPATKKYVDKTFDNQMEIANLTGNISQKDGQVYLHLHVTCCGSDYKAVGGHLLCATVNGACELVVEAFDARPGRKYDNETGLNLYDF